MMLISMKSPAGRSTSLVETEVWSLKYCMSINLPYDLASLNIPQVAKKSKTVMTQTQWTAVDDYITALLIPPDPALDAAIQSTIDGNLPPVNVAPNQGKLLHILALTRGVRTILEIGTLAGYSTIWLARALPTDGRLITLEANPKHAVVAQENINRAGLANKVELRLGAALDTLPQLAAEDHSSFDLVFIDADKVNTADYFSWALKLTRRDI